MPLYNILHIVRMIEKTLCSHLQLIHIAGDRIVRVRCPPNTRTGQAVQITIPAEDLVTNASETMAVLTSADGDGGGGAVRMNSVTRIVNQNSGSFDDRNNSSGASTENNTANAPSSPPQPQAYNVQIPAGVLPGNTFPVSLNGKFSNNDVGSFLLHIQTYKPGYS